MRQILALVLLVSSTTLFAAGREVSEPGFGPPPYSLTTPRVATSGTTFLTIWIVQRQQPFLFGSIADANGNVVTPRPFAIAPVTTGATPRVVAIGGAYLVVWNGYDGVVTSVIVASDGSSIRKGPSLDARIYGNMALASNAASFLIAGSPAIEQNSVVAHLYSIDGGAIRRDIPIASTAARAAVSATSDGYVVATAERAGIFATRLDAGGNRTAKFTITLKSTVDSVGDLAVDSTIAAWIDTTTSPYLMARAASVGADSPVVHDLAGFRATNTPIIDVTEFRDAHLVVAERAPIEDLLVQTSSDGALQTQQFVQAAEAIAANDSAAYMAGQPFGSAPVYGTTVHAVNAQSIDEPQLISAMPNAQTSPALASDGTDFLAAWQEQSWNTYSANIALLFPAGARLNNFPSTLGQPSVERHSIAFNGSEYLVASNTMDGGVLRRFRSDGSMIGSPVVLADRGVGAVASAGSSFALFTFVAGMPELTILRGDGSMFSVAVPLDSRRWSPLTYYGSSIASDGVHILVTLDIGPAMADPIGFSDEVDGLLFSLDGRLLGPTFVIATGTRHAQAASNGDGFVIAVRSSSDEVAVIPVTLDGERPVVGNAQTLFAWPESLLRGPDIAPAGGDYAVTWTYGYGDQWQLALAHVNAGGVSTVPIGPGEWNDSPAIAANAAGDVLVLNADVAGPADSSRLRAYRDIDFRPIAPPPAAPTNMAAFGSTVTWRSTDPSVIAFVIESLDGGSVNRSWIVPGDVRAYTFFDPLFHPVRVRALSSGGISAETPFVPITSPPRRRAVR